jgi:HEAT repeat protein
MRHLTAQSIIALLEKDEDSKIETKQRIAEEAPAKEMILALQQAKTDMTRRVLCELLGKRHERRAVPLLMDLLDDPSEKVSYEAADALGHIGDPQAGKALYDNYQKAPNMAHRQILACSLGSVKYTPATQKLIEALRDDNVVMRGCAAWALGRLGGDQALKALKELLQREQDSFVLSRLSPAIHLIESGPASDS